MKKLIAVALMGAVVTGVALASSLTVPFFNDMGGDYMAYIGVKNNTAETLDLTIRYFDDSGNEYTPADNTFLLPGGYGVSFRPGASDPDTEGDFAATVPIMTEFGAGSATISWVGGPSDLQGRMAQLIEGSWSAYLLPPGF